MAGQTPYFKIAFFDFHDRLDQDINVKREIDRFVFIDKQIYGLYSVFGDGVISGWEVFDNGFSSQTGISVGISPGMGIIQKIASQTPNAIFLNGLSSNSTLYVYAVVKGTTISDRSVNFTVSSTQLVSGVVQLATIVTSTNGITSIDNTTRDYISFEQAAYDAIDNHKHRGTPSKIDLTKEVKNQLSGAHVDSFDASKISSGTFSEEQVPVIDHNSLKNTGILKHSEIDTLLQTITTTNQGLFAEVAAVDNMKTLIFLKMRYSDVDYYLDNLLIGIPGVSDVFDTSHSTAYINTESQCLVGLPTVGSDSYVYTKNFYLPSRVKNVLLTSHKTTPEGSSIVFGVNTTNSVNFTDYQTITEDRITAISATDNNFRLGIKLTYNGNYDPFDTYNFTFEDFIDFGFINDSVNPVDFHFRIRWYTDEALSNLYYTAFSSNDNTGWLVDDVNPIPEGGYSITPGQSVVISYFPQLSNFMAYQIYYLVIDAWDGASFVSQNIGYTFISTQGSNSCDEYGYLPQVKNFAIMLQLENGKKIRMNL